MKLMNQMNLMKRLGAFWRKICFVAVFSLQNKFIPARGPVLGSFFFIWFINWPKSEKPGWEGLN